MFNIKSNPATILSILIAILAALAAAGGLFFSHLYRDNAFVITTWLGNDAVTLFLAVPILVIALIFSARGSLRARLVWLGALDYMLYNYAFYLFGAAFNAFFLVYAALLALSIFALIFGLASLDVEKLCRQYFASAPLWKQGINMAVFVGNQLAASVLVFWHPGSPTGFTEYVFTQAGYRGHGLERALLVEGLIYLKAHGLQYASLEVKAENRAALYRAGV